MGIFLVCFFFFFFFSFLQLSGIQGEEVSAEHYPTVPKLFLGFKMTVRRKPCRTSDHVTIKVRRQFQPIKFCNSDR